MAIQPFTAGDFRVFDLPGFAERMAAIRERVRPKLEGLAEALAPEIGQATGISLYAHVARHARRTVNPPDDTWVAFGPEPRGYKKAPHFKIAVSRHTLRLLFEVGPEHARKAAWARAWQRETPRLRRALAKAPGLAWFHNEHDETPAATLDKLDAAEWKRVGAELVRTRNGQVVLGRRVEAAEAARWNATTYAREARETFAPLRDCFRLA